MIIEAQQNLDLTHEVQVQRPHGHIDQLLAWCQTECSASWAWEIKTLSSPWQQGEYVFHFANKQDCFAFSVKWG